MNARRFEKGLPSTEMYLGLHFGEVFYGNIGSKERLDFTVVGPAVNEVSRIAAMCRSVDQPILLRRRLRNPAPSNVARSRPWDASLCAASAGRRNCSRSISREPFDRLTPSTERVIRNKPLKAGVLPSIEEIAHEFG